MSNLQLVHFSRIFSPVLETRRSYYTSEGKKGRPQPSQSSIHFIPKHQGQCVRTTTII